MNYKGCIPISEEQYERLKNIISPLNDCNGVERITISRKYDDELEQGKPIWNIEYIDLGGQWKIDDGGDLLHVEYERTETKLEDLEDE